MQSKIRFVKNVIQTASKDDTVMPWARGARRTAFIAKRNGREEDRKSA